MKNRTTPSDTNGLEAWLEDTRIVLPLRAVSVHADITAGFADVSVDQLFEQNNAQPLDCRFLFPLPAGAAAYRCEMHINGSLILAQVEECTAARKHFKELKASGRRAALAESERDNLFALSLGNIQPGDRILMRFAYLQPVQRLRERRTLRVPVNPGVRYIPGVPLLRENTGAGTVDDTDLVPDASRITPPCIDADHLDAAALHASVCLRGAGDLADGASSPSHPIVMKREGENLVAALAANGHLPDRDFIFTWNEKPPFVPVIRTWLDEEKRGILEIRLPVAHSTLASDIKSAPSEAATPDVFFLLDRSGSMQGANWSGACKAVAAFVSRLHPDTRVWLSLFETGVQDYDAFPVRAGDIDLGPDGKNIHRFGTGGGTELVPALDHLAAKIKEHSSNRTAAVLLITDGEIGNEHGVVDAAKRLGCPVHLVGVAMTANDGLDAIARVIGGRSAFLAPGEDIPAAVERFAPVLRAPVVTGLTLAPGWQTADESPLGDLCDGDDIVIPLSASREARDLDVGGRTADGHAWSVVPERQKLISAGLLWARARIRHLDACKREDDALALAKEFNLLSRGAAFIAWDNAEQVPVAQTEIVQPAMQVSDGDAMYMSDNGAGAPKCMSPRHSRPRQIKTKPRRLGPNASQFLLPLAVVGALMENLGPDNRPALRPEVAELVELLRQLAELLYPGGSYPCEVSDALKKIKAILKSMEKSDASECIALQEEAAHNLERVLQSLREHSRYRQQELHEQALRFADLESTAERLAEDFHREVVEAKSQSRTLASLP